MKDNAFGIILKLGIAGWTLVCAWQWFTGCFEATQDLKGQETALGMAAIATSAFWGAVWFFPTISGYLLYRVLGRSDVSEKRERSKRIVRDAVAGKWQCPWCFGEIDPRASVCPHCRKPTEPVT